MSSARCGKAEVLLIGLVWVVLLALSVSLLFPGCSAPSNRMEIVPDPPTTRPATGGGGVVASQDTSNIKAQLWATATAVARVFTREVNITAGDGSRVMVGRSGYWMAAGLLALLIYHRTARWHGKRKHRRKGAGKANAPPLCHYCATTRDLLTDHICRGRLDAHR